MIVAKVGGSLFDLPRLGDALLRWAAAQPAGVLFVPGGGRFADAIREADRHHRLGEEAAHWLAIRTLGVTAHLLAHLLRGAAVVSSPTRAEVRARRVCVLDCFDFFRTRDCVPHTWDVTTDSLALAAAVHLNADRLVLLKSVDVGEVPWVVAAARGWVDRHFPVLAEWAECEVTAVNFRVWMGLLEEARG